MTDLLISVECGEKTCGIECPLCGFVKTSYEPRKKRIMICNQFKKDLRDTNKPGYVFYRCPACLAAEKRAVELLRIKAGKEDEDATWK